MDDPHDLVVRTIREHAGALLRTARKHSLCADDAHDAYQRGLEIFLRRAATVDAATADRWLHVVIKHEALAIREARGRYVGADERDLEARLAGGEAEPDDRALSFDRVARSAEALARLKPQEVRALWLKAQGHSYAEIAASEGWSYTKVNRCIAEGRRSFLDRYASIERGDECRRWAPVISAMVDGEATADQLAAARPHLRRCSGCRAELRQLRAAGPQLAGVLPVAAVAVAAGDAPAGGTGGLLDGLSRALDGLAVSVHERASAWALKLQLAAEAASASKVAAVAASAVAVAGGGAATVAQVTGEGRRAPRPAEAARVARAQPASTAVTGTAPTVTAPSAAKVTAGEPARSAQAGASGPGPGIRRDGDRGGG
ncbi:MAG TPA: sigma-70 family RNA polymerase sigma factor, partial [Capillimicrobium sp.]